MSYTLFAQCTSPLTEASDYSNLIKACVPKYDSAGFYTNFYDYFFNNTEDFKKLINPREPRQKQTPRQREVGNAWLFNTDKFLKNKSRLFGNITCCEISDIKSLEIDYPEDMILIENIMKSKRR
jgi:CMP-N-acetylneuraminic acid synthetase